MNTTTGGATATQLTYVWALLSALTVLMWWLGAEGGQGRLTRDVTVTIVVLVLALAKVRFIIRWFMEVRTCPRWLRVGTDAWLVVLGSSVLALYLS